MRMRWPVRWPRMNAAALVHVPPIVHQVFVADQSVDQPGRKLHEDAEVGDAGDDAGEILADLFDQKFQDFYLPQLAFGIVGAALGEADVLAQFDELVISGDPVKLHMPRRAGRRRRRAERY